MVPARLSLRLLVSALLLATIAGAGGALAQQGVAPKPTAPAPTQPTQAETPPASGAVAGEGAAQPLDKDAPAAPAAPTEPAPPPAPALTAADLQAIEEFRAPAQNLKSAIEKIEKSIERNREDDETLAQLRLDLMELVDDAEQALATIRQKSETLRQQFEKLGPKPDKDAAQETEQVASERARLGAIMAEIDGAVKTGELVQVRARQLQGEVQQVRQRLFAEQILKRSLSPLSATTWQRLASDIPGVSQQVSGAVNTWAVLAARQGMGLALLMGAVFATFFFLTALVRRFLAYQLDAPRVHAPRFFEQAITVGWVAPLLAMPALVAIGLLAVGLNALNLLVLELGQIFQTAVISLIIFVAASALTRAILQPHRPAWRLVDLSTPAARTLTWIVTGIAAVFAADLVLQEAVRRLYLPLSVSAIETAVASIAIAVLLLLLVWTRFEPKRTAAMPASEPGSEATPAGAPATRATPPKSRLQPYLIKLPLLAAAVPVIIASLIGYIALGRFVSTQIVVSGSAIAVVMVVHLAIRSLLSGPVRAMLENKAKLDQHQSRAATRALAVLLNVALVLLAVPVMLVTWGYSPPEALSWLKAAVFGFKIGELRISVARILMALGLFLALVFATRFAQRWLDTGVLRSKRIDQGIADSIHTAVGYTGFIVAVLAAVSYGGLDITNFAIVAGALSVGIGFGLQSIVNNFVSGLILLVERPVKVGDRVSVKGQEGFVRRISVRSTEIETGDRASVIVPNSDLITSSVTNWTLRNTLGQATVTVTVSYQADPEQVRAILQRVGSECPLVLQHPPPGVSLDNLGPNGLEFSLGVVLPDVTKAGAAQTDLRFRILKAFREAGIEIPHAQHDVHLRDLDMVRGVLKRLAEERARQAEEAATVSGSRNAPPER